MEQCTKQKRTGYVRFDFLRELLIRSRPHAKNDQNAKTGVVAQQ
jgi:hypothetical protein